MSREEKVSQRRALKAAKRGRKRQQDVEKKLVQKANPGLGNKYVGGRLVKKKKKKKKKTD